MSSRLAVIPPVAIVAVALLCAPAAADGNFEIVRATADTVWRLDKRTGEMSICRLEAAQLVCTPARESAGGTALVKRSRVYYVARKPWRPFVAAKPPHGFKTRKWK